MSVPGIPGDPGAVEARADGMARRAAGLRERGEDAGSHARKVTANWTGDASDAAFGHIDHLGRRTRGGAEVIADMVPVLRAYAQELREAQAAHAAGAAQAAAGRAALARLDAADRNRPEPTGEPTAARRRAADAARETRRDAGRTVAGGEADMAAAVRAAERADADAARRIHALDAELNQVMDPQLPGQPAAGGPLTGGAAASVATAAAMIPGVAGALSVQASPDATTLSAASTAGAIAAAAAEGYAPEGLGASTVTPGDGQLPGAGTVAPGPTTTGPPATEGTGTNSPVGDGFKLSAPQAPDYLDWGYGLYTAPAKAVGYSGEVAAYWGGLVGEVQAARARNPWASSLRGFQKEYLHRQANALQAVEVNTRQAAAIGADKLFKYGDRRVLPGVLKSVPLANIGVTAYGIAMDRPDGSPDKSWGKAISKNVANTGASLLAGNAVLAGAGALGLAGAAPVVAAVVVGGVIGYGVGQLVENYGDDVARAAGAAADRTVEAVADGARQVGEAANTAAREIGEAADSAARKVGEAKENVADAVESTAGRLWKAIRR